MAVSEKQKANWRRYYEKNKDAIKARRKEREKDRPPRERDHVAEAAKVAAKRDTKEGWLHYALTHAKCRAKKKGLAFDVSAEDIILPDTCPVLGLPLIYGSRRRHEIRTVENIPTLDRVVNESGYVTGNVRVISARANSLKSNASIDELEKVLAYMRNHHV